jgi:hypothetical protein
MADYELIGLNEAVPDLRAPTSADTGIISNLTVTGVLTTTTVQATGTQAYKTNSASGQYYHLDNASGNNFFGLTSFNVYGLFVAGLQQQESTATYTKWYAAGSEAMRLTSTGDLLLGTTVSPSTPVSTNRYMRVGVNAIEEASSEITVTSTPQNITRQSGAGGSATIIYYNVSGGAQQTDIVVWTGSAASVIGSAGTSGLTITYGVNTGALTMATASGSAGVFVKALTVQ